MPAILVECLFVDSEDTDKYNPELIAKAIVNGLEGVENSNDYCNTWKLGWNKNNIGWWYYTDKVNNIYTCSKHVYILFILFTYICCKKIIYIQIR